jgi:hypothetical protein
VVAIDKEQLCQDLNDMKELSIKGVKALPDEKLLYFSRIGRALDKLQGKYCK